MFANSFSLKKILQCSRASRGYYFIFFRNKCWKNWILVQHKLNSFLTKLMFCSNFGFFLSTYIPLPCKFNLIFFLNFKKSTYLFLFLVHPQPLFHQNQKKNPCEHLWIFYFCLLRFATWVFELKYPIEYFIKP